MSTWACDVPTYCCIVYGSYIEYILTLPIVPRRYIPQGLGLVSFLNHFISRGERVGGAFHSEGSSAYAER